MKRLIGSLAGLALLVCVGLLYPGQAHAATDGFNIVTSPLPIKLTTTPGTTVTTELRMNNQGTQPENIKVGLMKFGASGSSGEPDLYSLAPSDTYASWVHFSPSEFTAQPNVWVSVKMTIDIPSDAGLGYYLAVTFSRASQPGVPNADNLKGAVATLVLLNVDNGHEKKSLQLSSFTTNHGLFEYLPADFSVKLHNNGNIYLAGSGNIFIQQRGKTIDTLNVNAAGGSILPGTNRVFTVPWDDGFPHYVQRVVNGKPTDNENLKWDFSQVNHLRIGRYTAKLLIVYDNGSEDVPLEATLNFWVLPWKLMLLALVVVALIVYAVVNVSRSTLRKTKAGVGKLRGSRKPPADDSK